MRLNNLLSILAISTVFVHALIYPMFLYGDQPRLHARNQVTVPSDPIERTTIVNGHQTIITDVTNSTSTESPTNQTTTTAASSSSTRSINHGFQFQIPGLLVIGTILLSWL